MPPVHCAFLPSLPTVSATRTSALINSTSARAPPPVRKRIYNPHPSCTLSSDDSPPDPPASADDDIPDANDEIRGFKSFDDEKFESGRRAFEALRQLAVSEQALCYPNPFGTKMSHEVVVFDEDGEGPRDKYVYVEERDCIGCTQCQTTAMNTFFMEDDHGRARVFDQIGDPEDTLETAIDMCPVNCIYYVSWDDLVSLELNRREQVINNYARLVGAADPKESLSGNRKTTVMDCGIMRCDNCPGRGCKECPMYGVGENPAFIRNKMRREAKKAQRKKQDVGKRRLL